MWNIEKEFSVKLGGNTYINTPNLVVYKGEALFKISRSENEGILGIDFDIFDAKRKRVATVRRSIVVQGDAADYDIKAGHDEYSVTEKSNGRLITSVKRRGAQGAELEVSVHLYTPDGFLFDATPSQTNVGGMVMTGCTIKDCGAGIVVA